MYIRIGVKTRGLPYIPTSLKQFKFMQPSLYNPESALYSFLSTRWRADLRKGRELSCPQDGADSCSGSAPCVSSVMESLLMEGTGTVGIHVCTGAGISCSSSSSWYSAYLLFRLINCCFLSVFFEGPHGLPALLRGVCAVCRGSLTSCSGVGTQSVSAGWLSSEDCRGLQGIAGYDQNFWQHWH